MAPTMMQPSISFSDEMSRASETIAMISLAAVITILPRVWVASLRSTQVMMRRSDRSQMSIARGQVTVSGSISSALPWKM